MAGKEARFNFQCFYLKLSNDEWLKLKETVLLFRDWLHYPIYNLKQSCINLFSIFCFNIRTLEDTTALQRGADVYFDVLFRSMRRSLWRLRTLVSGWGMCPEVEPTTCTENTEILLLLELSHNVVSGLYCRKLPSTISWSV